MTSQSVPKKRERAAPNPVARRTRGKVQPPAVPQGEAYWEELFQQCLAQYERSIGKKVPHDH